MSSNSPAGSPTAPKATGKGDQQKVLLEQAMLAHKQQAQSGQPGQSQEEQAGQGQEQAGQGLEQATSALQSPTRQDKGKGKLQVDQGGLPQATTAAGAGPSGSQQGMPGLSAMTGVSPLPLTALPEEMAAKSRLDPLAIGLRATDILKPRALAAEKEAAARTHPVRRTWPSCKRTRQS
jgi:hypothetical protein